MLVLLLLLLLRLFGYLLFLTFVLILFPTFVSHRVTPFNVGCSVLVDTAHFPLVAGAKCSYDGMWREL